MMTRRLGRVLILLWALAVLPMTIHAQGLTPDPAYNALRSGDVYVDPGLQGQVNAATLESAASANVKIAVLAGVPNGPWRSRDDYTGKLHHALHLGSNALVLVVPLGGRGQGITITSDALTAGQETQLAHQYTSQIKSDLTGGTAALAQAVGSALNGGTVANTGGPGVTAAPVNAGGGHGMIILGLVFLVVLVVIIALIASASRRRKQDLSAARGPVEALKSNVLSGIEYIDHYMDVLPKGNPDSDVVRTARQAAEAKYEQASQLLTRASSQNDLNQAQGILDRAQADIQQARGGLDRALGGTAKIPGDDAFRPPPLPQNQQQVSAIPPDQRAVSFFSGRPAPLGALVPVTLTVGGQPRQVYATPQEAAALRQGQMPQVRAFNVGGQYVPWYSYNQYDPYRDYWRYQDNGWGGFAGGALAGFVGAELLGDLMHPGYGDYGGYGGFSPYAFSPDFGYDQGYDAGLMNADQGSQFYDYGNANTGAGFDGGAYAGGDPTGGADFGSNAGDLGGGVADAGFNDWGGGDPSGGADFGGGGDFGGDFGGGDTSGGSDF